jgi:hypothetical protein
MVSNERTARRMARVSTARHGTIELRDSVGAIREALRKYNHVSPSRYSSPARESLLKKEN